MGAAIARTLSGTANVTGWSRMAGKRPELAATVRLAPTAADAVEATNLVITSVIDNAAVLSILGSLAGKLNGRVVVNMTNGTPEEARGLAQIVVAQGGSYIHGAIMAVPPMLGSPAAHILYSGPEAAYRSVAPVLAGLGSPQFMGQDPGRASLFELGLLSIMYGLYGGFFHAAATVDVEGQSLDELATLAMPWVQGLAGALPRLAQQMSSKSYDGDVPSSLGMQATGMDHYSAWSQSHGISGGLLEPLRQLMAERVAAGFGNQGIASVFEVIKSH